MKPVSASLALSVCAVVIINSANSQPKPYTWLEVYDSSETVVNRIPVPEGYERANTDPGSFEHWLRHIPLKKINQRVYLYNGQQKTNQNAHFAVIDIDIGEKDLQQCADAVIRLCAEYLYSIGNYDGIYFNFTSGDKADFRKWMEGYRPVVTNNQVRWLRSARKDSSYSSFRQYLETVFIYAGSYSLGKELSKVGDVNDMRIGDVFVKGGFPGHTVIVVDMAINKKTGKKLFLLAQSYTPAQDMHILRNPTDTIMNPWYRLDFGNTLWTPEWTFTKNHLKRFQQKSGSCGD